MPKVFILEDDPERIILFMTWLKGWDIHIVDTCEEANEFTPPYDLILLDHDLGGRQMQQDEDCGLTFMRLIKGRINSDALVLIHSWNPDGARAMQAEYPSAIIVPFGTAVHTLIEAYSEALIE